jgi:voltage-gated sodium channel
MFQSIRHSQWFSNLTTAIIIGYAIVLGIKTSDSLTGSFDFLWFYLDLAITLYFLFEVVVKISVDRSEYFKDRWNIFDFLIISITLIPISESEFMMIARLMRLFRVLRLFQSRPELKNIIDMLISAIPSIIDIVILMFIIFYVYGIVGSFLFGSLPSGLWDNLFISMLTLFRILTFEDWTDVMYEAMELNSLYWIYFVSFIIITAFVFFNLFVAVIIGEMENLRDKSSGSTLNVLGEKVDNENSKIQKLESEISEMKAMLKELVERERRGES